LIDIGVNLTHINLMKSLDSVISDAKEVGVSAILVTGTSSSESQKAIELCRQYPDYLFATVGCHPHYADDFSQSDLTTIKQLSLNSCVKALGECGLDFNRNFSTKESQIRAFEWQLELAIERKLPLFLHQRDAHKTFCEILKSYRSQLGNIVVHCFTDGCSEAKKYLEMDCYIGITGWLCDARRNAALVEAIPLIPDNRILLETDAPFLLPRNILPKPKSNLNQPKYLPYVCQQLAKIKNKTADDIAQLTDLNGRVFLNL